MKIRRTAAVCAIAAGLAATPFALAAPIVTTIRVEGGAANVLPETSITVDDAPASTVVVRDTTDPDTITVAAASATAQLAAATSAFGLPLGFDIFNFGSPSSFVTRIGTDTMPVSFSPSWRLKVNGSASNTGADTTILKGGDVATWAFVSDFAARELDLSVSGDKIVQGQPFTVTVRSLDNAGVAVPAAGAVIAYGDQVAAADALGKASLPATGLGVKLVSATRIGEVRSQSRAVCSYNADPAVCNLPPILPTTTAKPSAEVDTVAPGSQLAFPVSGHRYRVVRSLRGSAGPDRSDIATVDVAIARRVGTQCRFMGPKGGFSEPRPCIERRLIPTRLSGSQWVFPIPVKLLPGKYRAWSRATDGAGNREERGIAPINSISFIVLSKGAVR